MNEPELIHDFPIHVVGLGGVGSVVVEALSRGDAGKVQALHGWDGDRVDLGNLRGQKFLQEDVGYFKPVALYRRTVQWGGAHLIAHSVFVEDYELLSGVVIVCVDSMKARWTIWEKCIKKNPKVERMIETRSDALHAHVFYVNPNDDNDIFEWEKRWYSDAEGVNVGAGCGVRPMPSMTSGITGLLAAEVVKQYAATKQGHPHTINNITNLCLYPFEAWSKRW
jgi:hypothetical protein